MKRFYALTLLMWLALPLTALRYWLVWDRLPARMATHFAANGTPNGWMSREAAFEFGIGVTVFMLIVFTVMLVVAYRQSGSDKFVWAVFVFSYLIVGIVFYANESILKYNLFGHPVSVTPILIIVLPAVVGIIAAYLASHRGNRLPAARPIATETHSSPLWGMIFLLLIIVELCTYAALRIPAAVAGGAVLSIVFLVVAAFAWSGFQYRFSPAGVEISALGFRLRSLPVGHIEQYAAGSWNFLRGYGIRGMGKSRAYVWGNKGVLIRTTDGDVFLGHTDPAKVLRDLDAIKQFAH